MQYAFKFRGGKRKGAGRKNRSGQRAHSRRERVDFKKPLHITLKIRKGEPRRGYIFKRMKHACRRLKTFSLHVLHFALLGDHIHMIVEARNNVALTKGIQSLTGTLVKRFGMRFKDRFHLTKITSPRQMKNTYRYVLLNFAKHEKLPAHVDQYSTGHAFRHWRKLIGRFPLGDGDRKATRPCEEFGLSEPRSWLAVTGWMRA